MLNARDWRHRIELYEYAAKEKDACIKPVFAKIGIFNIEVLSVVCICSFGQINVNMIDRGQT